MIVLRVGDCGVQELQDVPRGRARRVDEYGTRLVDRLAADVVHDEPRLAGRGAHVAGLRADDDLAVSVAAGGRLTRLAGRHLGGAATAPALGLVDLVGLGLLRGLVGSRLVGGVVTRGLGLVLLLTGAARLGLVLGGRVVVGGRRVFLLLARLR